MDTVTVFRRDTDRMLFLDVGADNTCVLGVLFYGGDRLYNIFLRRIKTNATYGGKGYFRDIYGVNQANVFLRVFANATDDIK